MGLIEDCEGGTVVPVDGAPAVLGEVRMHQQIYRRRLDVGAICRFMSPHVMALAAMGETPRARHGFGAYFYPQPPMWQDPQLVRNDSSAQGVAETLGSAPAIVVGVNGAVTAAPDMPRACVGLVSGGHRSRRARGASRRRALFADAEAARQRHLGRSHRRAHVGVTHEPADSTAGGARPPIPPARS
jgi:hypothetical protein